MKNRGIGFLSCVLLTALAGAADGGDLLSSAKYLWYFDTDVNGNGVLDVDDVRDVRDWGSTAAGSYAGRGKPTAVSGTTAGKEAGKVSWVTGDVVSPAQGVVDSARYLDMVTTTNGAKKTVTQGFKMAPNSAWKGDISAVARVNVASFTGWPMEPALYQGNATKSWLISNGYSWYSATDTVGLTLGFGGHGSGYDPRNGILLVRGYGISNVGASNIKLATNTWYDVAWSVKINGDKAKLSFVVINAKSGVQTEEVEVSGVSIPEFHSGTSPQFIVGSASFEGLLAVNDAARFSGRLSRLAVWDKALTQDELLEVMTQPRPWFELGSANGSGEEFGLASEANYTYEIEKAPWHAMPRSLSADSGKQALTLVVPYHVHTKGGADSKGKLVEEYAVPYSFEVVAATNSGSATIDLTIQGKSLGCQTVSSGGLAKWYVPANTLTAADVAHTIVLTHTAGSGDFIFDKISMTGSFVLGRKSWDTSKYSRDRETNYVGMRDMAYVNAAPNQDYNSVNHRFFVPTEQATVRSYAVEAMAYGFGAGGTALSLITGAGYTTQSYPFCLKLNGEIVYTAPNGLENGTVFKVALPLGKVKAGWNTFTLMPYDGTFYDLIYKQNYWWMGFDYLKLSMSKEHRGLTVIVR